MFLAENLGGYVPRTAWAMEETGHSLANPRLLAESGIEALFIQNIEDEDRKNRLIEGSMEFVWRPQYKHLGRRTELLGHIFYDFDTSLLEILVDDWQPTFDPTENHTIPNNTEPNRPTTFNKTLGQEIPAKNHSNSSSKLRNYLLEMSQYYKTKHLLMMVGSNENFEKAEYYYQ
jgi:Glycosyl hydrolases family 38 N-terminal domain